MQEEKKSAVQAAADKVIELEAELEAAGNAAVSGSELARSLGILRKWMDEIVGVVSSPALGRVTLIHGDGRYSTITSPELAYLMTGPIEKKPAA